MPNYLPDLLKNEACWQAYYHDADSGHPQTLPRTALLQKGGSAYLKAAGAFNSL